VKYHTRPGISLIEFVIYLFLTTLLILLSVRTFTALKGGLDYSARLLSASVKEHTLLTCVEQIVRAAPADLVHWSSTAPDRCAWQSASGVHTILYEDKGFWLKLKHPLVPGKQRRRTEKILLSDKAVRLAYAYDKSHMHALTITLENKNKKKYEKTIMVDEREV
jgi:hypothetical protein